MSDFELAIENVFNGLYYGFVVSTVLFGVTTVQAWIYVRTNQDSWLLRLLVGFLSLDFVTTFLNSQTVYDLLLANFGNVIALVTTPLPFKMEILISFVVIFIVNMFFAYRIYLLRRIHKSVAFIVVSLIFVLGVMGLIFSVTFLTQPEISSMNDTKIRNPMVISLALSVVSDILSSIAISWSLHKSRTGFERSDSLVQKFFHFIVGRGLLLALNQITTLILLSAQENLNWIPLHFILTRLYVITIGLLNSRPGLKDDVGSIVTIDDPAAQHFILDGHSESARIGAGIRSTAINASEPLTGEEANRRYLYYFPLLKGSSGFRQ
ncbi:hypothetical protein BDP27DRAFT_1349770 [Rhodocollybia butyracea]|uniref:DUF6534 domain-containing protein n=1 Tax=Rhodocollybia butyracea TaxID=206335 RepID=A0A9P5P4H8_9AGAR|nr:hypothetical protein BDP27DRAFT_1349770 [Rhodocollybia butyracea]